MRFHVHETGAFFSVYRGLAILNPPISANFVMLTPGGAVE
jgi:hypothetical protein